MRTILPVLIGCMAAFARKHLESDRAVTAILDGDELVSDELTLPKK